MELGYSSASPSDWQAAHGQVSTPARSHPYRRSSSPTSLVNAATGQVRSMGLRDRIAAIDASGSRQSSERSQAPLAYMAPAMQTSTDESLGRLP